MTQENCIVAQAERAQILKLGILISEIARKGVAIANFPPGLLVSFGGGVTITNFPPGLSVSFCKGVTTANFSAGLFCKLV